MKTLGYILIITELLLLVGILIETLIKLIPLMGFSPTVITYIIGVVYVCLGWYMVKEYKKYEN